MKPLSRRSVTTGLAAAVTAIPVVGLCKSHGTAPVEDKLLTLIRQYEHELAAIDSMDDPSERQIRSWHRKARGVLEEAASLPCLTAASAVALLDLLIRDDMLHDSNLYSEHFTAMVQSARDYIASTGRVA